MGIIKRKEKIEVLVSDIVYGGNGIAKYHNSEIKDFIIFIKNGITGQTVLVEIVKSKPKYAEAKIIEVIQRSKLQEYRDFQGISGAPYYELDINYQQNKKKEIVLDTFNKIPEIENISKYLDKFIPSPNTWHYRNKMEYAFSSIIYDHELKTDKDAFGLGFKRANTWWMVENLEKDSGLFDKAWEDSLNKIRIFCINTGLPAWNIPQKKGFFRNLNVRKSFSQDKLLIELVTSSFYNKEFNIQEYIDKVIELHGNRIAGLIHTTNDNISDRIDYNKVTSRLIYGQDILHEKILGLDFEISMSSFFQTNPTCAEKLYRQVVKYSLEKNNDYENKIILDLFCGTGTIAQLIASKIKKAKIIGIDIVESAINNAKNNAKNNNIENVSFQAIDVGKFLFKNPQIKNLIDIIIIDPPRSGVAKKSIKKIIELNAKKIIYVSCNPATQSRDVQLFIQNGYSIDKFSIVDQFPHTHHIETIFILIKEDISYL